MSIFGEISDNGDPVAGVERVLLPPVLGHLRRIRTFGDPLLNVSLRIFYLESDLNVRIDKFVLRYRAVSFFW